LAHLFGKRKPVGDDGGIKDLPLAQKVCSTDSADQFAEARRWHAERQEAQSRFREELKARGAALQELFWEELERTRHRLRDAGYLDAHHSNQLQGIGNDAVSQAKSRTLIEKDGRDLPRVNPLHGEKSLSQPQGDRASKISAPDLPLPLTQNSPILSPSASRSMHPQDLARHAQENSTFRQHRRSCLYGDVPQPTAGRWLGEEAI